MPKPPKPQLELSGTLKIRHEGLPEGGGSPQDARLAAIEQKLDALIVNVGELKMANAETNALLDELNGYTNRLAATAEAQAAKVQEISDDIDKLIAGVADPELQARLRAHADALAVIATNEENQAATLAAIAAKHDEPLPPPVEG